MKKPKNEIYALVDERFLEGFSENHLRFMKDYYYRYYCEFCRHFRRKPLSKEAFFTNMHYRRIQLYQLCCPFCGAVHILTQDKRLSGTEPPNYCPNCGKASTLDNIQRHLFRFVRINRINRLGLKAVRSSHPDSEEWLVAYDCYQMEIVELASIIEVVFRDFFNALISINIGETEQIYNRYIKRAVNKQNRNDFMNIDKAHDLYKKAFEINLKEHIDSDLWEDLIDIINLRNMIVHNNGRVDEAFKSTPTFNRLRSRVDDTLLRLEDTDIAKYLKSVISAVATIANLYLEKYHVRRNAAIANYYFNHPELLPPAPITAD